MGSSVERSGSKWEATITQPARENEKTPHAATDSKRCAGTVISLEHAPQPVTRCYANATRESATEKYSNIGPTRMLAILVRRFWLEYVGQEMMTPVVPTVGRIVVVPLTIVNRNLHFRCISVIETIAAAIVLLTVEVLRIVNVWVVVEPRVIPVASATSPAATVSLLVCLLCFRNGCG